MNKGCSAELSNTAEGLSSQALSTSCKLSKPPLPHLEKRGWKHLRRKVAAGPLSYYPGLPSPIWGDRCPPLPPTSSPWPCSHAAYVFFFLRVPSACPPESVQTRLSFAWTCQQQILARLVPCPSGFTHITPLFDQHFKGSFSTNHITLVLFTS